MAPGNVPLRPAPDAPSTTPPPAARRLREHHAHLPALGRALSLPSLEACSSVAECLDAARRAAGAAAASPTAPARWALFTRARVEGWTQRRWPTLAELDGATADVPCVIMSFDHHSAMANSAALAAAGLHPGARVPPHGVVVVDPATGGATGLLLEQAAYAAWHAAPEPGPDEASNIVARALDHLAALGFSEVDDLLSPPGLGPILAALEREGRLPVAVRLYVPAADLESAVAARAAWQSPRIRLAGGKLFADGTLNSRTALMLHRYGEPLPGTPRGQCMVSPADLERHLRAADALGLPIAVHAIGDAAVRMTLDCFERVRPATPGGRIEHCEVLDRADVPRFKALGVTCSVQPCHLLADVEALERYLPHRLDRILPLRELLASGLRPGMTGDDGQGAGLVFGSDVPIVRADPADSIQAAVHRRRESMDLAHAIAPDQAISAAEAWACFGAVA